MIYGELLETTGFKHKLMIPQMFLAPSLISKESGTYRVLDTICEIQTHHGIETLNLTQKWPIKTPRPVISRQISHEPLISGQRVIDTLFPIAKGGAAAIPGGF